MTANQGNINLRAIVAQCVFAVVDRGRSLADELPNAQLLLADKDQGLAQELCYGVLRYLPELEDQIRHLMDKALTKKQRVVHFLLLVGLYQFKYTRIPDHATVAETVAACIALKQPHLKGLVNAVLRNYQRNKTRLSQESAVAAIRFNHPSWFINKLTTSYPQQWQQVLLANQQKPPMWLRVNQNKISVDAYLALLEQASIAHHAPIPSTGAIKLQHALDVNMLPGFHDGLVSVQDGAAQFAATLLDCQSGDRVLDCCAAPGGKTCHMLELCPELAHMTAIDVEAQRLVRVEQNLSRLQLTANVIAADASNPNTWWDGQLFDRILLDAPCSGTGVIRRHPDIKWLRKAHDIETLQKLQRQIISAIWPLLKSGGTMLYATCSVLAEENCQQMAWLLANFADAEIIAIKPNHDELGWQLLPDEQDMDGFYYAKLMKK